VDKKGRKSLKLRIKRLKNSTFALILKPLILKSGYSSILAYYGR
jgi:hypothetical protein